MNKLITEKEKKHYDQIMALKESPISAGINRVLVIQIREEDEVAEHIEIPGFQSGEEYVIQGSFVIPKSSKAKMKNENETVKAVVKSVGVSTSIVNATGKESFIYPIEGDIVFVFPNVFETMITIDGVDYMSYSERDLVAIVKR